ncbi:MAG TPA: aspartate aminotransferase family protein [Arenicellales bacterium]|nr:aspartate aminotransferase family protein [Acidobacteriota bacterium]MDP6135716.1 aspartate aminotransferase family protein [Arenicellales bacterium]MDP7221408.1 aspartate aminotransferase family protein [Arenicellales bacterium]HJP11610.1 aspartate aminotransferase family protein [Arenicellales bacterium]
MTNSTLLDRRDHLFGKGSTLFYEEPVQLIRGEGVHMYDESGRRYVDLYNNVPCVGHCHPQFVETVSRQVNTLNVHSRYLHESILDYAERLIARHDDSIGSIIFSCTGTEANEIALRMARLATGGRGIICTDATYHGNSVEVSKLTRPKDHRDDVRSIPFPETYRNNSTEPQKHFLEELQAVIDSFKKDNIPFAGILVCPIFANEGLPNIPAGFMPAAVDLVHDAGGVFIADEVQSGLCRTGLWWGYELMNFVPDIVTMGKPLGGGIPLAATAASTELIEMFRQHTRYFNTCASSPVQAAAGNAVLDIIEQENLCENVSTVGAFMRDRLVKIQTEHSSIGDVRGHGLFLGLEWVTDLESKAPDKEGVVKVVNALKDRGYLTSNAGAYGNVLKIRPPLVFSKDDAEEFLNAFEQTLETLDG